MKVFQYSVIGMGNPLGNQKPSHKESRTERYCHITPKEVLIINGKKVRTEELTDTINGIEEIKLWEGENQTIVDAMEGIKGVELREKRKHYLLGQGILTHSKISFEDYCTEQLTLSSESPYEVQQMLKIFQISEPNKRLALHIAKMYPGHRAVDF